MTPETAIKRVICTWLKYQKCFCFVHDSVGIYDPTRKAYRTNKDPHRIKGVSDVLGIWKGKFLAIEVKVPGKYPTHEQRAFLDKVNKEGGIGFVARSLEDVIAQLGGLRPEGQ